MDQHEAEALWRRVQDSFFYDGWTGADMAALSPMSPLVRQNRLLIAMDQDDNPVPTILGFRVLIDPQMKPNELKLIAADGSTVRIVNIGE